jgi:hypothetical protein
MSFFKNLFRGTEPEQSSSTPDPAPDGASPEDRARLAEWLGILRADQAGDPSAPFGRLVARAGELALGSPYAFKRLDAYLRVDGEREAEPLTLSLTHFEAVTLIESCVALARCARQGTGTWEAFGREVERIRYRGGRRDGYLSRLHYFSEWISDNAARGNVRDLGRELGGVRDDRPLRFMTTHRSNYPALHSDGVFEAISEYEKRLDQTPRWVVPQEKVSEVSDRIEPGDILAFASGRRGLDVSHAGIAYRDDRGTLRVLQALFSANRVEVSPEALPEYVASRKSTGILVARPL